MGAYVSLIATLIAISPSIEGILTRGKSDIDKQNTRDGIAIVVGIVGSIGTLIGRYKVGDVYTPKYIPGSDIEPPLQ